MIRNLLKRLLCAIGIHASREQTGGFQRTCTCCGTHWVADYFQWRRDGFPIWHRFHKNWFNKGVL